VVSYEKKKNNNTYDFTIVEDEKKLAKNSKIFRSLRMKNNPGLKDASGKKLVGGQDTCQGDSGGPLWVMENGKAYLVGVVNRGRGCAKQQSVGIYARVKFYLKWIFKHVNKKKVYTPENRGDVVEHGGDDTNVVRQIDPCTKQGLLGDPKPITVRPYCRAAVSCKKKQPVKPVNQIKVIKKIAKKNSRRKKRVKRKKGKNKRRETKETKEDNDKSEVLDGKKYMVLVRVIPR